MSKNQSNLKCAYLYADGHAVLSFEKRDAKTGVTFDYVEIIEHYGPQCSFTGRLIFSNPNWYYQFDLAKKAVSIRAVEACASHGSDKTRQLGIAVGSVTFNFAGGKSIHFNQMPNLISGEITYQPEAGDVFNPDQRFWGTMPVAKIVRKKSGNGEHQEDSMDWKAPQHQEQWAEVAA